MSLNWGCELWDQANVVHSTSEIGLLRLNQLYDYLKKQLDLSQEYSKASKLVTKEYLDTFLPEYRVKRKEQKKSNKAQQKKDKKFVEPELAPDKQELYQHFCKNRSSMQAIATLLHQNNRIIAARAKSDSELMNTLLSMKEYIKVVEKQRKDVSILHNLTGC